jgi:hypothetical protein
LLNVPFSELNGIRNTDFQRKASGVPHWPALGGFYEIGTKVEFPAGYAGAHHAERSVLSMDTISLAVIVSAVAAAD